MISEARAARAQLESVDEQLENVGIAMPRVLATGLLVDNEEIVVGCRFDWRREQ